MDTRLVNIIELASELAEEELNEKYGDVRLYEDDGDGGTKYTDEAQKVFDFIYEKYYTLIDKLSINEF